MVNLVQNPGFELDPCTEWYTVTDVSGSSTFGCSRTDGGVTFSWATDQIHGGSKSVKIVGSGVASTVFSRWLTKNQIVGVAGKSYNGSVWVKTSGVGRVELTVNFWSGIPSSTTFIENIYSSSLYGTNDWKQIICSGNAPVGTAYIRVELRLWGSGTVWFDDVLLESGTVIVCGDPVCNLNVT